MWRPRLLLALLGFLAAPCLVALPAAAERLDEALYARLLEAHSREVSDLAGVRVDYAALRGSEDWRALVRSLDAVDPKRLEAGAETVAFWINAYNILAIDLVLGGYPVDSIRDLGSFLSPVWKRSAGRVGGRDVTLHEIEHEILRPMGDPRIHAALVCASLSCPALRREPWTASRLEAQYDDTITRWMADRRKGLRVDAGSGSVRLSRIFDWFEEDFAAAGGALAFAARYAPAADRAWLEANGADADLRYFDYDWSLNDLAAARPGG